MAGQGHDNLRAQTGMGKARDEPSATAVRGSSIKTGLAVELGHELAQSVGRECRSLLGQQERRGSRSLLRPFRPVSFYLTAQFLADKHDPGMTALGDLGPKADLLAHFAVAVENVLDSQSGNFSHAQACEMRQHQREPVPARMFALGHHSQQPFEFLVRQYPSLFHIFLTKSLVSSPFIVFPIGKKGDRNLAGENLQQDQGARVGAGWNQRKCVFYDVFHGAGPMFSVNLSIAKGLRNQPSELPATYCASIGVKLGTTSSNSVGRLLDDSGSWLPFGPPNLRPGD
jgi:hypothetical protein